MKKDKKPSARVRSAVQAAFGKVGGRKGGPARAKKLDPERRREIAREAAAKRWAGHIKKAKKANS